eukprot:TCONS_00001051-protein
MDFSKAKGRSRRRNKIDDGHLYTNFPNPLMMYNKEPPRGDIALEEFETYAVDRLKLLREVENINIRFKKNSPDHYTKMKKALVDFSPNYFEKTNPADSKEFEFKADKEKKEKEMRIKLGEERRKDYVSHFILRLAFARSEDLRRWFLTQELELFRFKFTELKQHIQSFLQENQLEYKPIDDTEKNKLANKLKAAMFNAKEVNFPEMKFYKVPFTSVLDLVRSRKVYLEKGEAYVPETELVSIILGIYRTHLSQALALTAKKLPYIEEDTRLLPMLKNLSSAYIGDSYTSKKENADDKLSLANMEEDVVKSYPICMRNLHEGLRKDHHLKHWGRLQYGLFIKAAGLSLEEALLFWRSEFTKKMDLDKFEKQYAYNVRHSYGKEGKRADYTPYSCMKIITTNQPGPGDFHGCPFKHSDNDILKRRLQNYKIPNDSIKEILDLAKQQHYQIACSRYFEVTHKLPNGVTMINHPNQYFDESKKFLSGEKSFTNILKEEKVMVKTEVKAEPPPPPQEAMDVNFDEDMEMC